MKIKIWSPDDGCGEEDAKEIEVSHSEDFDILYAVEIYAKRKCQRDCEYPSHMDFCLRLPTGENRQVAVIVESEPVFKAVFGKPEGAKR
jgi:hypothetical protein